MSDPRSAGGFNERRRRINDVERMLDSINGKLQIIDILVDNFESNAR